MLLILTRVLQSNQFLLQLPYDVMAIGKYVSLPFHCGVFDI